MVTSTYTYNDANRLKTASILDFYSTYAYNGDGLLMRKTADGLSTYFTYDVNAALPVVITDSNSLYLYGLSLIAQQQESTISCYHQDALGSVRNLTDGSGSLTMSYGYDPFGQATSASGTADNPFRYTGQYLDNQTGLYHLRARYYQPATGRFVSPDTIVPDWRNSQALNYYAYVHNNPLEYIDPSGHFLNLILGAIGGAIGGAAYGYGSQVVDNLSRGMGLGDALTTNIDPGKVALYAGAGAVLGTIIVPGVAAGVSLLTGSAATGAATAAGTATLTAAGTACLEGLCQEEIPAVEEVASEAIERFGPAMQAGEGSVWTQGWGARGEAIDEAFGHSEDLPWNFPTIDSLENGIAISNKSVDLNGATYQDIEKLTRLIQGYIDKMANYQGSSWRGVTIRPEDILGRGVNLGIPAKGCAVAQLDALEQLIQSAQVQSVILKIKPFN